MQYRYILTINGMMCGMCEAHINDVIRKNFSIKKVSSSHIKKQTIIINETEIDESLIKDKISETGYIVENIKKEEVIKKESFLTKLFKKSNRG